MLNNIYCYHMLCSFQVLAKLMYSDKLDLVPQPSETERFPSVPRSAIFACVFQRCSDVSPSVRAAALRCLADITADQRGGVEGVVQQILSQVLVSSEVPCKTCIFSRRCLREVRRQRGWQNFWKRCV